MTGLPKANTGTVGLQDQREVFLPLYPNEKGILPSTETPARNPQTSRDFRGCQLARVHCLPTCFALVVWTGLEVWHTCIWGLPPVTCTDNTQVLLHHIFFSLLGAPVTVQQQWAPTQARKACRKACVMDLTMPAFLTALTPQLPRSCCTVCDEWHNFSLMFLGTCPKTFGAPLTVTTEYSLQGSPVSAGPLQTSASQ